MKVLFPIGTLYPSQEGGPSNTVYWMAKALAGRGVEVTLVTTDLGAEGKIETDQWLVTTYGRVIYYARQHAQLPFRMILAAARLIKYQDCIHLNSLFYPPSFLLAIVALWKNKTVVWSCRGNLHPHALLYGRWKKIPVLWLIRNFLSGRRVYFHSTSVEESKDLRRVIGANIRIVELPNYLEIPATRPREAVTPPFFLYVGRLHAIKALDQLLESLALCPQFMHSGFQLKIAGADNTPHAIELQNQVARLQLQNRVVFLGLVEGAAKEQLYADAYFTILPSHSENFGNVVVESLAQGTPVIASKGTPWEMLEEEHAGFWVDNAPKYLAESIDAALFLSASQYQDFRANALKLARHRFDILKNIQLWIDTYQTAITQKIA